MRRTSEQLAWLIRRHGIEMTHLSGGSHIGAILSVADIMAVLYADVLNYKADEPKWAGRDRFILSKGHAGASVYAALAEEGFFPVEELKTHYQNGSRLSGHVSHHLLESIFRQVLLGMVCRLLVAWLMQPKKTVTIRIVFSLSSAMVNAMKVPFGKRPSLQIISA